MKSISNAIIAGLVLCSVGCGSAPVEEGSESLEESTATVLFHDSFADGGILKVVEQDNGGIGLAVKAPIGSEASKLALEAGKKRSLVDVYAALHPGGVVPQLVRELSDRRDLQKNVVAVAPKAAPAAPLIEVDKSEAWFTSNFCKNFNDGSQILILEQCKFRHTVNRVTSNAIVDSNTLLTDRSYALNESASLTASHWIDTNSWVEPLPPGLWQWVEWYGNYEGGITQLKLPGTSSANLGITVHDNRPD